MENIQIPDDFYTYNKRGYSYLCHKSCVAVNGQFSNHKYIYSYMNPITNENIAKLRYDCCIIDEVEEKTYFVNNKFNNLTYGIDRDIVIRLRESRNGDYSNMFANVNDFIDYLNKNYPESVKSTDIKIALKD